MNPAHWWSLALPPFAREAFLSETAVFFRVGDEQEPAPSRGEPRHAQAAAQRPGSPGTQTKGRP